MRFNSELLMDELALMNIYVAGLPEGIKVTVLTWQRVCYYVFNDRGPFYSLSTWYHWVSVSTCVERL